MELNNKILRAEQINNLLQMATNGVALMWG